MRKVWSATQKRKTSYRDYGRKRYGNPLYGGGNQTRQRSARNSDPRAKLAAFFLFLAVLAVGGVWYAVWGPALRITDVVIEGASAETKEKLMEIANERLAGRSALVFPQSNVLFFSTRRLKEAVGESFFFETFEAKKTLPHTLAIAVSEKRARAVLADQGRFYALDESGILLRELTDDELSALHDLPPDVGAVPVQGLGAESAVIDGPSAPAPTPNPTSATRNRNAYPVLLAAKKNPGESVAAPNAMALILEANARLPDVAGAAVRWYTIQDESDTVDVTVDGDWHVLLTASLPFGVQSERLGIVLKEKIGARKSELDYIDLRYNERIFFRFKEAGTER